MPKGGGGSSSESSNSTSTTTQDNKVSATDSAIALGTNAQFNYSDQFSDNVKSAFSDLITLAENAGLTAIGFANNAIQANQNAVKNAQDTAARSQDLNALGSGVLVKDIVPMLIIGALGFGAIAIFKGMKAKK